MGQVGSGADGGGDGGGDDVGSDGDDGGGDGDDGGGGEGDDGDGGAGVMAMMGMIVKQRDADAGDYTLAPESPAWLLGIAQVRRIISRQAGPDILIFSLQL